MIPDEAVEAAVPRITGFFDFRGLMLTNEAAAKLARLTIEAAAPHLTKSPAEQAMADIEAHLERWFNGEQTQTAAMAAVSRISGRYKMEAGK